MKISIIFNPKSGKPGRNKENLSEIHRAFSDFSKADFTVFQTAFPGHATKLARESAERRDNICFAAGGDGTMNEVALGLLGSKTSMGLIPLGSGNGLARHLNIPLQISEAISILLKGRNTPMDHGEVNQTPFFLAAGIGFEGVVARRFAEKKSRGFISYLRSSAEEYFKWKPLKYTARYEDEVMEGSAFTIDFANGSQYGNNAIISPGAAIDDGLLQFVRVLPFPLYEAPGMIMQLLGGRINRSGYHLQKAFTQLELSVEGQEKIEGHTDGEPREFTLPLSVKVIPSSLLLRVPAAYSQPSE
jgi:YegS/Rv2252/BmrU family lipid kinase